MQERLDLAGHTYASWTVLRHVDDRIWLCRCKCGDERPVRAYNLRNGTSTMCRTCSNREGRFFATHGMSKTAVYKRWAGMLQRCYVPQNAAFKNYGGRGITVCKRWHKFENFLVDMGEPPTRLHTLERINNDRGYSPQNCCWATVKAQNNNRRKRTDFPARNERGQWVSP